MNVINSGCGAVCSIATTCIGVGRVVATMVSNTFNKGYSLVVQNKGEEFLESYNKGLYNRNWSLMKGGNLTEEEAQRAVVCKSQNPVYVISCLISNDQSLTDQLYTVSVTNMDSPSNTGLGAYRDTDASIVNLFIKEIIDKTGMSNGYSDLLRKVSNFRLAALVSFGFCNQRAEDLCLQQSPAHIRIDSDYKHAMYTGVTIGLESKSCTKDIIVKLSKLTQAQHFQKHIYVCDDNQNALKNFDVSGLNAYTHLDKDYICIPGKVGAYEVITVSNICKENKYFDEHIKSLEGKYQAIALVHRPEMTRHKDAESIKEITIRDTVVSSIKTGSNISSTKMGVKRHSQLDEYRDSSTDSYDIYGDHASTSKRVCFDLYGEV
ncbi:MAG: hypothetical protein QS748_04890 [Candidatus Endonucleobacter bathymodioli]|uniref:Uncharacterized protein n=1 Tax=Candidatus Endonucleibacter bathymodioli TaxID=539814 RepID=A0AA90NXJ8_9GAMM|nr:hypothetical protein [Candidatus Endonucleobacter bathymodioli]